MTIDTITFYRFFIFYNGIINQMAGSLDSFIDDRKPLCETLSLDYANGINSTFEEISITQVWLWGYSGS